jgi:hypothetical protein
MPGLDCVCADKEIGAAHFSAQNMSLPAGYLRGSASPDGFRLM